MSDSILLLKIGHEAQLDTHKQHKDAGIGQVTQEIAKGVELQGALRVADNGLHDNDTMIEVLHA